MALALAEAGVKLNSNGRAYASGEKPLWETTAFMNVFGVQEGTKSMPNVPENLLQFTESVQKAVDGNAPETLTETQRKPK